MSADIHRFDKQFAAIKKKYLSKKYNIKIPLKVGLRISPAGDTKMTYQEDHLSELIDKSKEYKLIVSNFEKATNDLYVKFKKYFDSKGWLSQDIAELWCDKEFEFWYED